MVQAAEDLKVAPNAGLMKEVNAFKDCKLAERNLRKVSETRADAVAAAGDEPAKLEQLKETITAAIQNQVDKEYIDVAQALVSRMKGNMQAKELLRLLMEYP